MSLLVVAAHPDDEVLGAGATMYKCSQKGEDVYLCILSGTVFARENRPTDDDLANSIRLSSELLGVKKLFIGCFPNIEFNNVAHLQLVKFIEKAIVESGADIIITHHPADTNNDHLHTSIACQAAIRLFQRRDDIKPIKDFLYMEIPSATDWGVNRSVNAFSPNTFVQIGADGTEKKLEALSIYKGVMRDYPHPRSKEGLLGLAAYRGSQSGTVYAEAFESAMRRIII